MEKRKVLIIYLMVSVLAIASVFGYLLIQNNFRNSDSKKDTGSTSSSNTNIINSGQDSQTGNDATVDPYKGWKEFTSEPLKVKLKYPDSYIAGIGPGDVIIGIKYDVKGSKNPTKQTTLIRIGTKSISGFGSVKKALDKTDPQSIKIAGKSYAFSKIVNAQGFIGGYSSDNYFEVKLPKLYADIMTYTEIGTQFDCSVPTKDDFGGMTCEQYNSTHPSYTFTTSQTDIDNAIKILESISLL